MRRSALIPAATSAALCALLAGAAPAFAQEAETGPMRAPAGMVAPTGAGGEPDTALPVGAAPVPEERGPLGEPAPMALPENAGALLDDAAVASAEPGAALGEPVGGDAALPAAAETDGPLGAPVPMPTRRSFLPIARTSSRQAPVSALGAVWGLTGAAFLEEQLRHPRVVDAQLDAKFDLKALFAERGLSYPPRDLFFRLFKQEQVLEVWVRDTPGAETYTLLREYPICAIPGRLGPKIRVDDYQAPEGFYYIQGFNPESEFHLSLRLNYPNAADRIIGVADAPGGDIYIHGGCSTVGCFPMTDETIAELYWLAVETRAAGQSIIPVHVFPARLDDATMNWLSATFSRDRQLVAFWENLREGYQYFENNRRVPAIGVDGRGRYVFNEPGSEAVAVPDGGPLGAEVDLPVTSAAEPTPSRDSGAETARAVTEEPVTDGPNAEPAPPGLLGEPVAPAEATATPLP